MSNIGPIAIPVMQGRVAWIAELIWRPRGVWLDISKLPKANSTTNHPFYDSNTGKWVLPTGTILAKTTAGGWTVLKRMIANGDALIAQKDVIVDDADYAALGDTFTDGTTSFIIDSIDYDAETITATVNLTAQIDDDAELWDDTTYPGAAGPTPATPVATDGVKVLHEDMEYTSDIDQTVEVVNRLIINESAMPIAISPDMKVLLHRVDWL